MNFAIQGNPPGQCWVREVKNCFTHIAQGIGFNFIHGEWGEGGGMGNERREKSWKTKCLWVEIDGYLQIPYRKHERKG